MAQSLSKVYLHIVFSTKQSVPTIDASWEAELHRVLGGLVNQTGCQSLEIGGMPDHVHILCQFGRTVTIAELLRSIKTNSSAWVNETHRLTGSFHWQGGCAAFSVSQSNVDTVREYLRNQATHHAEMSFQDELRMLLQKHEVEWDERYGWD